MVKKPEAKPSPIAELLKFFLVIALVGFVGFFIVCSVQLGEIGH